jgi:hypothetical protein
VSPNMTLRPALALLVLAGSLWSILRGCAPPVSAAANHRAVGYQLSRALAAERGLAGGTFKVIGRHQAHEVLEEEIRSFLDGMKEIKGWAFGGREDVPPPEEAGEQAHGVPVKQFADALSRCQGAQLVVSFVGVPAPEGEDLSALLKTAPALVVVNGPEDRVRPLVQEGAVRMAVVFKRAGEVAAANEALDPESWFHRFYEVVHAPAP